MEHPLAEPPKEQYAACFNEDGGAALVLVCDHASRFMPESYRDLGLSGADLERHIAWDIGALAVAQSIATTLDAPLVHPTASRLIIDCNRDPATTPDSIPPVSEDTIIPGNAAISAADRAQRIATIYEPFHALVDATMARQRARAGKIALIAIHSFTPVYHGEPRPWDIGVIIGDKSGFGERLVSLLKAQAGLTVGINEPYSPDDRVYHTLERHGVAHDLPTAMIEVRQDHLAGESGQRAWAARLSEALRQIVEALA